MEIVKQYSITDANYTEDWKALKGYYENPRQLVNSHRTTFYVVKPMKNESAEALSQLSTGIFRPIGALKSLGRPTDKWSDLIVFHTVSRFEEHILQEWQKSLGDSTDPPTAQQLRKFMIGQIVVYEAMETRSKATTVKSSSNDKNQISRIPAHIKPRSQNLNLTIYLVRFAVLIFSFSNAKSLKLRVRLIVTPL